MATQTQPINGSAAEAEQQYHPPDPTQSLIDVAIEATERDMARLKFEEERFGFQQRRARLFAKSGMFGGKDMSEDQAIAQAMVRVELGESMGFSAAEALQGIDVINNRAAISSGLRAARMQAAGYSWDLDWFGTNDEPTGCRLWLYRNGRPVMKPVRKDDGEPVVGTDGKPVMEQVSVAYMKSDAEKMLTTITDWEGVPQGGRPNKKRASILEKDNWKMTPKNMYFARVISNTQRWYAPGVLNPNLLSFEEAMDADPEEAIRGQREVMRSSVSLDQVRPSGDANRGHEGAMPQTAPAAAPPPSSVSQAESSKRDLKTYASGQELPDAFDLRVGTEAYLIEGNVRKLIRVAEDPGEAPAWRLVSQEPWPAQESATTAPQEGAQQQATPGKANDTAAKRSGRPGRMF